MQLLLYRIRGINKDLKLFWLAIICLMFGFGIYSSVYYNFLTEIVNISPDKMGIVEAFRESPGFLCAGIMAFAVAAGFAEPLIASFALFLMAIGMFFFAGTTTVVPIIIWSFIYSTGMHMWFPMSSALSLDLAKKGKEGKRLGQSASIGSFGAITGMLIVSLVNKRLQYSTWFIIAAVLVSFAAITLLFIKRSKGEIKKPKLIWKRKYRLYYALTLLEGCRKQVFATFAIYALTREYHTSLKIIAVLMVINGVFSMLGAPIVGKMIDKIGERKILMFSYTVLIFVFIGYATIKNVHVLYVLYTLDNVLWLSAPCLTTYLQKIAEPTDLTPSLSMGITINHTAAVAVPLVGGFLWNTLGYPITFFGGAVVVMISLLCAARLGIKKIER